jgi:hypothetical protein
MTIPHLSALLGPLLALHSSAWNLIKTKPESKAERFFVTPLGASQLATGGAPILDGRRQPSCGGTSRMTRECQVRICEGLGVKFPGPTRHEQPKTMRPRWVRCSFESSRNRGEMALIVPGGDIRWASRYIAK